MGKNLNYYGHLGVDRTATREEIRRAYREAVLRLHPDVNVQPGDTRIFITVQEAYDVLSDQKKRAEYDKTLSPQDGRLPIVLTSHYSRSVIPRLNEPQLVYTLLEIKPTPEFVTGKSPQLNICLVLDRSTSMQGLRLDAVKDTAINLARQLRPEDTLSIVTFSDRAKVLLKAGTHRHFPTIKKDIRLIDASGGTEIYQGLVAGMNEVSRYLRTSAINQLILITDGRTYGDEVDCLQLADQAAEVGVVLNCLGIGHEWNDRFLDDLASRTGGNSCYISDPSTIEQYLETRFENFSKVYADRMTLTARTDPEVSLLSVYRMEPDTGPLQMQFPIPLGTIYKDGSLHLLFEFEIHPPSALRHNLNMIDGRINLEFPGSTQTTTSVYLNLNRDVVENPIQEMPPEPVLSAVRSLTLHRLGEKARHEVGEGRTASAVHHLGQLATRLIALGEKDLTRLILSEVKNIQGGASFSAEAEKHIKYGTRALISSNVSDRLAL
jgi:Ca-activated chloride channel homolog